MSFANTLVIDGGDGRDNAFGGAGDDIFYLSRGNDSASDLVGGNDRYRLIPNSSLTIVDTSGESQMLEIADCDDPATVFLTAAGDPGASGFRVKVDFSWEFNWQSDDQFGNPLPSGTYCARVTTELTNQMLASPPIRLR